MKKTLTILFSVLIVLIFGQNRKGEFQLEPNSSSHTLYVAFKKIGSDNKDVAVTVMNRNSQFRNFVQQNQIQFDNSFGISEKKKSEMSSNCFLKRKNDESVQKLSRIYKVIVPKNDNAFLLELAEKFEKFSEVDYASLMSNEPIQPPMMNGLKKAVPTPNLESLQTYLFGNPGISADYAWNEGVTGQGITIRDVEYGFNLSHEMLADQSHITLEPGFFPNSTLIYPTGANYEWLDHGTAVASILGAKKDGIGVSGTVSNAIKIVSYLEWTTLGYNRIAAVTRALEASNPNEIVIYEMQTGGQNGEYVPAEYNNVIWDLTKAATDSGIVVIAAAGNGSQNLDAPFYNAYNARGNSGAIIVGAGSNTTAHSILYFSTYGSRVNLQGWGQGVMAAGYGYYAQYDNDYQRTYSYFSGTSSATPVVASAFALVQSYYHQQTGGFLSSSEMLSLLTSTGYPQGGDVSKKIGPLPNVKKAIEELKENMAVESVNSKKSFAIEIAPNPAQNFITIKSSGKSPIQLEIISVTGQAVMKQEIRNGEGEINISKLTKGNYIIKATEGNRSTTEKLIKK